MNSEEISKIAKVSRSTVSRVINNYKNVPEDTRLKVQRVIDEYGYTPNISARTLAGKSNNIVGLFIADFNDENSEGRFIGVNSPYNMEMISSVIKSCKRRGYLTLVYTIEDLAECQYMEQYFSNRMIYGGIFVGFPYHTKELKNLSDKGHNIVLIDELTKEDDIEGKLKLVNSNNVKGGYLATKYLIDKGHKKIAHITGDNRLSSVQRQQGYELAMRENGITIDKELILAGQYREDIAYKVAKQLLEKTIPTAFFVANDIMVYGVVRAINEKGLRIPEDISIIGYDNLEGSIWVDMHLTSMYTDLSELAEMSVSSLFSKDKNIFKLCNSYIVEKKSVKQI